MVLGSIGIIKVTKLWAFGVIRANGCILVYKVRGVEVQLFQPKRSTHIIKEFTTHNFELNEVFLVILLLNENCNYGIMQNLISMVILISLFT